MKRQRRLGSVIAQLEQYRAELLDEMARVDNALRELGTIPNEARILKGPKALLVEYFQTRSPTDDVTVGEAITALRERGWATKSGDPRNLVASTLGQLARDGAIRKIRPGIYRAAPIDEVQ